MLTKFFTALLAANVMLAGCAAKLPAPPENGQSQSVDHPLRLLADIPDPPRFFFPMSDYEARLTHKRFGQQVRDRFSGWHVGDDLEVTEEELETQVPVYAIADGKVIYRNRISGYGGVLVLEHDVDGQRLQSLYGHIDLSSARPRLGDQVRAGTLIALLAPDKSYASDFERKHLHFGLYSGTALRLEGYVETAAQTADWIHPLHYLTSQNALDPRQETELPDDWEKRDLSLADERFRLRLALPRDWEIIAVEESDSLRLGPAQTDMDDTPVLLRFFDAANFLTLSTVTVQKRELQSVRGHEAIRYLIEKKPSVGNFTAQPAWRNQAHEVVDVRAQPGFSRFYAFARHPELEEKMFFYILHSMEIIAD